MHVECGYISAIENNEIQYKEVIVNKLALSKVFLLGFLASSYASANQLDGVIGIGVGFGGDEMMKGVYTTGESDKIKGNEGISLFGGADYTLAGDVTVRATVGYKTDSINATNGEITFSRVPLELTGFKNLGRHRLGGGLAYHTSVNFECKVDSVCSEEIEFDNATGLTAQYEYVLPELRVGRFTAGIKYNMIEYKAQSTGETFDGSGIELTLSLLF